MSTAAGLDAVELASSGPRFVCDQARAAVTGPPQSSRQPGAPGQPAAWPAWL